MTAQFANTSQLIKIKNKKSSLSLFPCSLDGPLSLALNLVCYVTEVDLLNWATCRAALTQHDLAPAHLGTIL